MTSTLRTVSFQHPKAPELKLSVGQRDGETRVVIEFPRAHDDPYASLTLVDFIDLFGEAQRIAERIDKQAASVPAS
jgi:hypothetical protein